MNNTPVAGASKASGRFALLLGLALAPLGVLAYIVQVLLKHLVAPWYLPVLASVGVCLLVVALWRHRSLWRWAALALGIVLAGFSWTFLLASRLPAYAGPVARGEPFPAFATVRADGASFTQRDLVGGQDTVLVFFRGRW